MCEQQLISVYTASRIIGVTPPTLYAWVRKGILTGHRDNVTGQLFVNRAEVESLAPGRRIQPVRDTTAPGGPQP